MKKPLLLPFFILISLIQSNLFATTNESAPGIGIIKGAAYCMYYWVQHFDEASFDSSLIHEGQLKMERVAQGLGSYYFNTGLHKSETTSRPVPEKLDGRIYNEILKSPENHFFVFYSSEHKFLEIRPFSRSKRSDVIKGQGYQLLDPEARQEVVKIELTDLCDIYPVVKQTPYCLNFIDSQGDCVHRIKLRAEQALAFNSGVANLGPFIKKLRSKFDINLDEVQFSNRIQRQGSCTIS